MSFDAESKYYAGQRWSYSTRPGEEKSSITVMKVESLPTLETVVHVTVDGLRINSPTASGGVIDTIRHMPFAEASIDESVTSLLGADVPVIATNEGYEEWRRAFDAGSAGVFTITVADGVDPSRRR